MNILLYNQYSHWLHYKKHINQSSSSLNVVSDRSWTDTSKNSLFSFRYVLDIRSSDKISITTTFKQPINGLYNEAINTFLDSHPINFVLVVKPPFNTDEKLELPTENRVNIAESRFGYYNILNSYFWSFDPSTFNICSTYIFVVCSLKSFNI